MLPQRQGVRPALHSRDARQESLDGRYEAVFRRRHERGPRARDSLRVGGRGRISRAGRDAGTHRVQRRLRLPGCGVVARRGARPHARPHLQPQHQPDRARLRGEGADPRGCRLRDQLLHRHGGREQHPVRAALGGRPRRLGQGHLRWHQPAVPRFPASRRHRGGTLRHQRPRADRGGHRQGLPPRLPGDPDQPHAQGDGHRPAVGRRARGRGARRRRQHLRDAHQPEPAGAGRRSRAAQRHQVPRRPCRRAGRRALRRFRADRQGLPLPRDHGRVARPDGRLPARPRHEDPGLAHRGGRTRAPCASRGGCRSSRQLRPSTTRASRRTFTTTSPRGRCAASAACSASCSRAVSRT